MVALSIATTNYFAKKPGTQEIEEIYNLFSAASAPTKMQRFRIVWMFFSEKNFQNMRLYVQIHNELSLVSQ